MTGPDTPSKIPDQWGREAIAEYWGGELCPADRWGRAPIRGHTVRIAHEVLLDPAESPGLTASRIADRLIEVGILPNEMAERT